VDEPKQITTLEEFVPMERGLFAGLLIKFANWLFKSPAGYIDPPNKWESLRLYWFEEEPEEGYQVISFTNDGWQIGLGYEFKWCMMIDRSSWNKMIRWYIWRWIRGEWFGLKRWLFYRYIDWKVRTNPYAPEPEEKT